MQAEVYNKDGQSAGKIDLKSEIFGITPNEAAMHMAVVFHLANKRQGTRKTKIRSEVSGGGKKPWKQKGRGTARAGSTRSPIWVGGGTIHGPKPQLFHKKLNKKVNRLARRSALSSRIAENNYKIVEDFNLSEFKTKEIANVIKNLQLTDNSILFIIPEHNEHLYRSARNINRLHIKPADQISTYDILSHKKILLFKGSIEKIEQVLN
ncbi:MAG: 50S ribosomal protein L4 [Candidatus Kapaibacterium sp.]